jgi:hypothetical protein
MRREDGRLRMEDSRQDLRMEFRAATESSGLAGFGLASVGFPSFPGFGQSLGNSGDIIINSIPAKAGRPCADIDCILG